MRRWLRQDMTPAQVDRVGWWFIAAAVMLAAVSIFRPVFEGTFAVPAGIGLYLLGWAQGAKAGMRAANRQGGRCEG